jgi:uncharacterized protein (TIGR00369 family)
MERAQLATPWPSTVMEEGEWAGWTKFIADPFEEHAGPFYHRRYEQVSIRCAMRVSHQQLNGGGFIHGGALMTFADYCLFAIAQDELHEGPAVTATFNSEFISAVPAGALIECTGEVIRSTRSLIFVRGLMTSEGAPVLSFSGLLKRIRPSNTVLHRSSQAQTSSSL